MRHAKSSWHDPAIDDHERALLGKGRRAVEQAVTMIRETELRFDRVLASTAVRAVETANLLTAGLGFDGALELNRRLYLAEPATYLEVLGELEEAADRVLVIGHNPGISELVFKLTGEEVDMPTAAIVHIELPVDSFAAIDGTTHGRLVTFWRPQREDSSKRDGKDKKRKGKRAS